MGKCIVYGQWLNIWPRTAPTPRRARSNRVRRVAPGGDGSGRAAVNLSPGGVQVYRDAAGAAMDYEDIPNDYRAEVQRYFSEVLQ